MNIETLIPHRPPARLVERVVRFSASEAQCIGRVADTHPFAVGDEVPVVMGIELAAQTAAVFHGLRADLQHETASRPVIGYLTTLREVQFHRPTLPVGHGLIASIRATGGFGRLFLCDVEVHLERGLELVVTATLGTVAEP